MRNFFETSFTLIIINFYVLKLGPDQKSSPMNFAIISFCKYNLIEGNNIKFFIVFPPSKLCLVTQKTNEVSNHDIVYLIKDLQEVIKS